MGTLEILFIVGGATALLAFVWLWRRFPTRRRHLAISAVLGVGGAVFVAWWVLFRIDDPTFARDRDRAVDTQKALDDALGKDF